MWFVLQPPVSGGPFKLYSPVSNWSTRVTLTDLLSVVPVYICSCLCLSVWLGHIRMWYFWGYFKVAVTFIILYKILNNTVCTCVMFLSLWPFNSSLFRSLITEHKHKVIYCHPLNTTKESIHGIEKVQFDLKPFKGKNSPACFLLFVWRWFQPW